MLHKIEKIYYMFRNVYMRFLFFFVYVLKKRDEKKVLAENKKFKNIHKGEKCFILGNGPSLKTEDLKQLENEFVFSVNQLARNSDFEKIKPNYHFWADENFFVVDETKPEDLELLENMKKVKTPDNSPECFFPIQQKPFIEKYNLDADLKINYFYTGLCFYDGYDSEIDYTKAVPGFGTVVQWCITMAIYMGFSEIYLLGCDNTGLVTTIKSALKSNDSSDYAYEVTENERKRMESLLDKQSLEAYVNSYLETLKGYRYLFQYCEKRGIKLVNCSSTTVIDSIPRDTLTNILKNNLKNL